MFRNLRINIFIYYFLTVTTFLIIFYALIQFSTITNIYIIAIIILSFVILSAIFISKLAVDPLYEYVINLQNLSKETLHELNLPITTIISNTDMLKKNSVDSKNLKRIARIESACNMLQNRYNELDHMIKTQTFQEIQESFELDTLIEERVTFLQHIYPHIDFKLSLEKTTILNDKIGFSKVIDNIIENGIKYSQQSTIIDIKLNQKTLLIQDFGCGMDEVELVRIFDNYYQSNENMQGFGIGLSMVKRFCDKNSITLNFYSKIDYGTTVSLSL